MAVGCVRDVSGEVHPIPRYYKKWIERHHPGPWLDYMNGSVKKKISIEMEERRMLLVNKYKEGYFSYPKKASEIQEIIINSKNEVFSK